ncbi:hypothetical protein [Phenylobacterium sp.]|uniref:hypothetical protein n=1 Tax=Phenylobacterium sp. TaxID=1871053 RepID=UPI0035B26321
MAHDRTFVAFMRIREDCAVEIYRLSDGARLYLPIVAAWNRHGLRIRARAARARTERLNSPA